MKNYILIFIFAVSIVTSCDKSNGTPENDEIKVTLNLSSPSDSTQTKVAVDGLSTDWLLGDKIGFFSTSNSNKQFSAKNGGKKAAFDGSISSYSTESFIYFIYPMVSGKSLDASNYYSFNIATAVNQPGNAVYSQLDSLLIMVGNSSAKVNANGLSTYTADENSGNISFHYLTAKMDFIITNNTGSAITITDVSMVAVDNSLVFSTQAKIKLQPDASSVSNYPDNASDFVVSAATDPSISVHNSAPVAIASGSSVTLSTMILPISVVNGKQFFVDVVTNSGTYRETKTIGGTAPFNFVRGKRYKILSTLNATSQSAGSNIYPGTPYPVVTLNLGSLGSTVFAPVNAGYIAVTRPYGLMYQWHRKYGQDRTGVTLSATVPTLAGGNLYSNKDVFYTSGNKKDWCDVSVDSWSMANEYNPCPTGWKVPTEAEMNALLSLGNASTTSGLDGVRGLWIGGNYNTDHVGSLFLPEPACRKGDGSMSTGNGAGVYWTTGIGSQNNVGKGLDISSTNLLSRNKNEGNEVRCVKQ